MLERDKSSVANRTLLAWILTSSMSSLAYSLETEEPITVNKARTPQSWARFSTDYVRCFCNLPQCVSTGYMCLSSEGGCFSSFLDHAGHHSKDYRGRHGCLEFLSEENRVVCAAASRDNATKKKTLTFCCHYDMCNHVDSPQTKDIINNTQQESHATIGNLQQPIDYTNSQVWFRAATIAVPVCGAVILFVLIALAVKILRSENQNHATQKLGTSYEHHMPSQSKHGCDKLERTYDNILRRSQHQKCLYHQYQGDDLQRIQVPLLIQNKIGTSHTGNKNETNAKLNLMQGEHVINDYKDANVVSVVLDIEKITPKCSKTNLVHHVNTDKKYLDDKFINEVHK
ncbi:BMP and activin membrane-bound inhibitor homolog [Tribolium madens]|uniref:BMP and activin membrane-bound inhibitor homolog n=1 Tax=Tribolium madens TaxID=41895 RepID=UPI001CF7226F|nr:BMP and activin membrane-bound inhibitor homolog [Tribolium madens]